jgi:Rieske Fe-S protein
MTNISRRSILKVLMVTSTVLVVAPLAALAEYLNIPYVFKPVKALIPRAKDMSENSSLDFQWPTETRPFDTNILIRDGSGNYHAYNRVCTHLQCFVNYDPDSRTIQCPCHGSKFDPNTGKVISGPAPKALPEIVLQTDQVGNIYAVNTVGQFGVGRVPRGKVGEGAPQERGSGAEGQGG